MTGSFPLMQVAREFELDYGDVLLVAHWYGCVERGETESFDRRRAYSMAQGRIWVALGDRRRRARLQTRLHLHARQRWSQP